MSLLKGGVRTFLLLSNSLPFLDWDGNQICSVKTSVWYSVQCQQNLKVFFFLISTFWKIEIYYNTFFFLFKQWSRFLSLNWHVIGPGSNCVCPSPTFSSNFHQHTKVTECCLYMNAVWNCILIFFNTTSCSYSVMHSSHLAMVLFGKQWTKISLYISSAHWTLKSSIWELLYLVFPTQ